MLCNAVRTVCRNVRNCDASLMSSIKINVIITCCQLTNVLQPWQLCKQFTGDIDLINKDGIGIFRPLHHLFGFATFVDGAVGKTFYLIPREVSGIDCMAVEYYYFHD